MSNKSYNQLILAALERNKPETADRFRQERDLAYIDDVHGFSEEIKNLISQRKYGQAMAAMLSFSDRLAVMAGALRSIEKI